MMGPDEPPADYTPPVICRSMRHIRADGNGYYDYFCESAHNHFWGENWWGCFSEYAAVGGRVVFRFTNKTGDIRDIDPCPVCYATGQHLPLPDEIGKKRKKVKDMENRMNDLERGMKTLKEWMK